MDFLFRSLLSRVTFWSVHWLLSHYWWWNPRGFLHLVPCRHWCRSAYPSCSFFSKALCVFFIYALTPIDPGIMVTVPLQLGGFLSSSFRIQLETHLNLNKRTPPFITLFIPFIHPAVTLIHRLFVLKMLLRDWPPTVWVGILILILFPQYVPPDLCVCNFVLEQSLSVRALQEMLANTGENGSEGVSTWIMF